MKNSLKKIFCFDIDGVILSLTPDNDYSKSKPINSTVKLINTLYNQGHYIIIFTARGYITKINWESITIKQLQDIGLLYHELKFGKPAADYYIDDRFISLKSLQQKVANHSL